MLILQRESHPLPRIHLMAGKVPATGATAIHHSTYERNLRAAVAPLAAAGVCGLIEPICAYGVPDYYLHTYERAVDVLAAIARPASLRLQLDVYHLQHIAGNVTHRIGELMPWTGHVQVAQVPARQEPHTAGELDFAYVFAVLEASGYAGEWIGLEYRPRVETRVGLTEWLSKFGYAL